jgi:activator of HSP90 ATPase
MCGGLEALIDTKAVSSEQATRRQLVTRGLLGLGALFGGGSAFAAVLRQEADKEHLTHLHQEVVIDATPHRVYEALLDEKQFAALTKSSATIDRHEGGTFSTFGGIIIGRNIELVPDKRVVQAWKPKYWPAGVYSLVKFELVAADGGTKIVLDHTGFPEGAFAGLDSGWPQRYWEPMKKFLA